LPQYFFDTSALVKRYHEEEGTPRVRDIFTEADSAIRVSTLGTVEIFSAFAIKVRSGQLTREAAQILSDGVLADVVSGRIVPYAVRMGTLPTRSAWFGASPSTTA